MIWFLIALPATIALLMTILNVFTWPRGRPTATTPTVSVLIPARNEAHDIERAVRSALEADVLEVIAYDDQSTDATPELLAALAAEDRRVRLLNGPPLPPGWIGKPHACHRLAEAAAGELLLFLDADVELLEGGVSRICYLVATHDADVVTAVPRQITGSFVERLIIPLLHVAYVSWLPTMLVYRSRDPRFLAANGQVLAVRREAHDAIGGFEAVRDAVVDDMAFCRRAKEAGKKVVFADGHHIARCRMYRSGREVREGFSKNIYEGIGSVGGLVLACALLGATFIAPWLALAAGFAVPALLVPGIVGVGANVLQRSVLVARHTHPLEGVVLQPLAVGYLIAIALNSYRWHRRGEIRWSGRSYARKEQRGG